MAKSFARLGYQIVLWDVLLGDRYDLNIEANVRQLFRVCCNAHFVHMAPPCNSFSIARRGNAPRSKQFPMGKPGLGPKDQHRVDVGNRMLGICVKLVAALRHRRIACSVENPHSSRLWICIAMLRVVYKYGGVNVVTVCCAWGEQWMKRTRFVVFGCPQLHALERTCRRHDGKCQYTNEPHRVLQGMAPGGQPWTRIAQPYPRGLCSRFAQCVRAAHVTAYSKRLEELAK